VGTASSQGASSGCLWPVCLTRPSWEMVKAALKIASDGITNDSLGISVSADEVLIIGAGPYGLSISAHLRSLGIDHNIVGRPMDTWRAHMPRLMNLKSEPYGSDIASPQGGSDIEAYCRLNGLEWVPRVGPLPLERFLAYADWFTSQQVPGVVDRTVADVSSVTGGFRVTFSDADAISVREVVVATGLLSYAVIPPELSGLPTDLVSHTSSHRGFDRFAGKSVAILGAGQSALETAALLHEAGAEPHLIHRGPELIWLPQNPLHLSPLQRAFRPITKTCEGWKCLVVDSPVAFGLLPERIRVTKARTVLGPAGAWWLKDRVDGVVDVRLNHRVRGAEPTSGGVRLLLDGPSRSSMDVDHVIVGTGFRVDIARLGFLNDDLRATIATVNRYPVVGRDGMSSVPGLYFAGAATAVSLGPSVRFISGTHNTARRLASSVGRRLGRVSRPEADSAELPSPSALSGS
jgi:FAD-dependent urate hydroxylase